VYILLDRKYLGTKNVKETSHVAVGTCSILRAPSGQYSQNLLVRYREKKIRERKGGAC